MYKNLYKYILFPRCLSRHLGSPQWSSMVLRRHRLLLSVMFISSPPPLSGFYRKHPSTLYPVFLLFFFLMVSWPLSARSIVVSSQPLQPYVTVSGIFATPNTTRFSSCLSFHVILLIHINIFISFACNIIILLILGCIPRLHTIDHCCLTALLLHIEFPYCRLLIDLHSCVINKQKRRFPISKAGKQSTKKRKCACLWLVNENYCFNTS